MGNRVSFDLYCPGRRKCKMERGGIMYEGLVAHLQENPANQYTVKEAEKLADRVLEIGRASCRERV